MGGKGSIKGGGFVRGHGRGKKGGPLAILFHQAWLTCQPGGREGYQSPHQPLCEKRQQFLIGFDIAVRNTEDCVAARHQISYM